MGRLGRAHRLDASRRVGLGVNGSTPAKSTSDGRSLRRASPPRAPRRAARSRTRDTAAPPLVFSLSLSPPRQACSPLRPAVTDVPSGGRAFGRTAVCSLARASAAAAARPTAPTGARALPSWQRGAARAARSPAAFHERASELCRLPDSRPTSRAGCSQPPSGFSAPATGAIKLQLQPQARAGRSAEAGSSCRGTFAP
eukprot:352852-Chlamydomonas_euryale.AAC.5